MKNNTPSQSALKLPLLLCGLTLALTLTARAQSSLYVSGTAYPAESDMYYTATGTARAALQISGTSAAGLNGSYSGTNINLSSTFANGSGRFGAYVYYQAALTLTGGTISTTADNGHAVTAFSTSTVALRDVHFTTTGSNAHAVNVTTGATLMLTGGRITTAGIMSMGVLASDGAIAEVRGVEIVNLSPSKGYGLYVNYAGTLTATAVTINTSGTQAHGVGMSERAGSTLTLNRVNISVAGEDAFGVFMSATGTEAGTQTVIINGGEIRSAQSSAIGINSPLPQVAGSTITPADDINTNAVYAVTVSDGAKLSGTSVLRVGSIVTGTDSSGNPVQVDKHTVANVQVNGGAELSGDVNIQDTAKVTLNISDTAALTGNVTGSGTATLDLTVSGPGSTLLGDIAQHDQAAVTVTISDGATGSGGFAGGNLITGEDSTWTFNQDSHGNYGENNGTWNLGDYDVTFDNLTHSGTLNISVNSDTGAGGSITVTGTADGAGTVHIDTTGNGKADPNQVLPGIVSGNGTEHWQWDPIDWGIDTIIKDGDHFVKHGTSPAVAVLNSSVAIQQAMWFAQQNSLLKRMGELRYGPQASRLPAGGTPALHIIENLWLRSYGQQLNVGSQVAGKASEQLIYGVDLGTDHKFTINADSDLYLGVYAGYGRSDLDYRTPGADGELNSYYGGLYATWLHSSGFYIDATFKAASVDNDLKAPYGNHQLTASYSDVNIGGSIEIGNKFTFADDWFIEPQFQVNYLHILAENYTAGPLTISAQDLDALQLRIGSLFGRTIKLTNSGAWQPYIKISGVETISSGGAIRNGYQHTRANTDGARAELGGGLIWQLDADNQLHLDYEASFGDKYDKPWGLTAGYRHQF
ncbi:MAG: autotransporter outer membrane beta-barrel domain-containing protein [Verrucomicrobiales bacterium]|jgi:outer membrane autotransporter protein|nr:autotransporter outer membrane beta-barrel domain-containing protein [Verrucomicrobiales bacterium]